MDAVGVAQVLAHLGAVYRERTDEGDAAVWLQHLGQYPTEAVVEAAEDWVECMETRFPSPPALLGRVQAAARRLAAGGRTSPAGFAPRSDGTVGCRACGDTRWVLVEAENGHEYAAPCPSCDSAYADYWREGHMRIDHNPAHCTHPICVERARYYGRTRRGA